MKRNRITENKDRIIYNWLQKADRYVRKNWGELKRFSKREHDETLLAINILKQVMLGKSTTETQRRFLRVQIVDLIKVLFLISLKAIPSPIPFTPIVLVIGNRIGVNFLPTSHNKFKVVGKEIE
jgi:hypothetical protein